MGSSLDDFYFLDPRLILIPIEHLTPVGVSPAFSATLRQRCAWGAARVQFLNDAFARYWSRSAVLATCTPTWAPPRLRNVALIAEPQAVRPYVQLLNTSSWALYASDVDPESSDVELAAYLLVLGDRMALTGEVTLAPVHTAAYWFDRSEAQCAAFAAAAARCTRPDADGLRAVAAAITWLRQLNHETLRPPPSHGLRSIPGTGLLVPDALVAQPPALIERWTTVATNAVNRFHAAWRTPDLGAVTTLCDWLATAAPRLLITSGERILWSPDAPTRLGALRTELRRASGAAVRDVGADLRVVDRCTGAFLAAVTNPAALPMPAATTEQGGYSYMHRERKQIAYNLDEAGMERRHSPAQPYAREMLAARTVHEWTHLAVDAGWVPRRVTAAEWEKLTGQLTHELETALASAPPAIRAETRADLAMLVRSTRAASPAAALVELLLTRVPDYQANLLSQRFLSLAERETYIRHNIRTLRGVYAREQVWRMLVRYLSEYQYLRFSAITDVRTYFLRSTWFDADFFGGSVLDEARFARLTAAVGALCDAYVVDEKQFLSRHGMV